MAQPPSSQDFTLLSRRAARRLIQRAFVIAGRDRSVRQQIREVRFTTLWILEEWDFAWSVFLDRGKLTFDRRPARKPDATLAWPTASEFSAQIEQGHLRGEGWRYEGPEELRRISEPLFRVFAQALSAVLENPVDENGDPLV